MYQHLNLPEFLSLNYNSVACEDNDKLIIGEV